MDLRTRLEPLFLKYGVDIVFAGHEHFYERIVPQKGIYYFTQGGSAKLREGNIRRGPNLARIRCSSKSCPVPANESIRARCR